jgi:hypothetical protein
MGLFEAAVPKKYRAKFTRAVAAKRVLNKNGKKTTIAQANAYYKAINALPLPLQVLANKRAN